MTKKYYGDASVKPIRYNWEEKRLMFGEVPTGETLPYYLKQALPVNQK